MLKGHLDRKRIWPPHRVISQCLRTNAPFHGYLVVNPKRVLEFKMAGTVGLKDISSIYIPYEVSCVMYLDLMSCKPTLMTILNPNSLFVLTTK